MIKRIIKRMRQLYRMYRMAKIIEVSMEQKDIDNKGKDLTKLLEDGLQPNIDVIKLTFQSRYKYSFTDAKNTYNDLVNNEMVKEYDKTLPLKGRPSLKLTKYTELNTEGRKLIDRFIIPWGLLKAYVVEYGILATTFVSLGIGIAISTVGKVIWSIIEGKL